MVVWVRMSRMGMAVRFYGRSKPLRVEEVEMSPVEAGEVLVDVKAAGVCASDLHFIRRTEGPSKCPVTLGHEGAGVVEEVGSDVTDFEPGDRVCIHYVISCGRCDYCLSGRENLCPNVMWAGFDRDGTYSEYIKLPSSNVLRLPDGVSYEEGALIGCAVVTPFHAMRLGEVKPGDEIVIIGVGGVGMHAVQMARVYGAGKVIAIDLADYKLKLTEELGADVSINPREVDPVEAVKEATGGVGADVVLEFVGTEPTIQQALEMMRPGGRTVLVGLYRDKLELDVESLLYREAQIRTSMDHTKWDLKQSISLVENGRIDLSRSITHRLRLEKAGEAINMLEEKTDNPLRIVLKP